VSKPDPAKHPEEIVVKGISPDASTTLRTIASEQLPTYDFGGAGDTYTLTLKPTAANDIKNRTVEQSIEAIRTRVDTLGVSEPVIEEHGLGNYQILVQLPGVDDSARVKEIIKSTARLEIRQCFDGAGGYPSEEAARQAHGGVLPPNTMLMHGRDVNSENPGEDRVYIVGRVPIVGGTDIRHAEPSHDERGLPSVVFNLSAAAGNKFASFTAAHNENGPDPNHYLAIDLDNKVREAASIRTEIHDRGEIVGGFTEQSAKDLSMLLNSGALPASITYLQETTVGPSLGIDSIRKGVEAAVVGMLAVMVFMLVYYRGAGINADLALFLNLVILLGFMGFTGSTLTLPGIAGVILTVGMGVDSNVLIFERIREELRHGKAPSAAVDQGFARAWVTILDTHVTTIVSAFILFIFGTGPVKGFAVTLTFGLLANLFTAVFVSRVIFDGVLSRKQRGEALSI
jgi:preprotein translocase subunit SecD